MQITYSVIVLTYNQLENATIPCVESLLQYCPLEETEIILVDNASSDGTRNYLKTVQHRSPAIRIILNDQNKGFSGGNNDGLKVARGKYVIILNNDTLVTPEWLPRLVHPFTQDQKVGIVGPVTNYAGTEQRIALDSINEKNYIAVSSAYTSVQLGVYFTTRRLSFFCTAIKRELLETVGLLDEQFTRGMFEDDDYCTRAIQKGYSVVITEDCFVFHKGSTAFNTLERKVYEDLFEKNRKLYERKHELSHLYTQEGLAYFKKITRDLDMYTHQSEEHILRRVQVRMQSIHDFLQYLVGKELELKDTHRVAEEVEEIQEIRKPLEMIQKEYLRLRQDVSKKKQHIEDLDCRLNTFFESPIFSIWRKFSKARRRIKDILQGKTFAEKYNPYSQITHIKKIPIQVISEDFPENTNRKFTLVVTVKNEEKTIELLLTSILDQTLIPNEVIIIDGGSTDTTMRFLKKSPLHGKTSLKCISGRYNIPQGRNEGIRRASNDLIVSTDAGCILDAKFLQNMTGPLFKDRSLDLVGGIYYSWHDMKNTYFVPNWERNLWDIFLPSARAVVLRKSKIQEVGYFPEELNSGEDTLFDIRYRAISKKWVFNTQAKVYWKNPENYTEFMKLARRYGYGDGLSGVGDGAFYYKLFHQPQKDRISSQEKDSFFEGYIKGRRDRAKLEHDTMQLKELTVMFVDALTTKKFHLDAIQKLQKSRHKIFLVFSEGKISKEKTYLSPLDMRNVEIIHLQDFDIFDVVDRYLEYFQDLNIVDRAKEKRSIVLGKSKRLEAFFTVKYLRER